MAVLEENEPSKHLEAQRRKARVLECEARVRNLIILLACGGAVAGWLFAVGPDLAEAATDLRTNQKWAWIILCSLVGLVIGASFIPAYRKLVGGQREILIESVSVEVNLFGTKLSVKLTSRNRAVGWKLFVEAATRITTQSLVAKDGGVREALTSMYLFFKSAREELKTATPSGLFADAKEHTLESYVMLMLNDALRPLLARWHPRLQVWEKAGKPESEWPLENACRQDIETTRVRFLGYTWGLGDMLNIAQLEELLPPRPQKTKEQLARAWTSDEMINIEEEKMKREPKDAAKIIGWHLFVELVSRVAAVPHTPVSGALRQAIDSLHNLYDFKYPDIFIFTYRAGEKLRNVANRVKNRHHALETLG